MTHGRKICISVVDELCLCTARFLRSRITNCEHRFEQKPPPRFWRSVGVLIEGDTCMPRSLKLGPGMHCGKAELVSDWCSRVQPSCARVEQRDLAERQKNFVAAANCVRASPLRCFRRGRHHKCPARRTKLAEFFKTKSRCRGDLATALRPTARPQCRRTSSSK